MRPAMSSRTFVQGLLFFISLCAALLPSTVRAQELTCPPCSDGNLCTSDSCDTTTGTCRFETALCDDANPCTVSEVFSCKPGDPYCAAGQCTGQSLPVGTT